MRALLQRVSRAAVRVEGEEVARIGTGLLILLGVAGEDPPGAASLLAQRCAEFRIYRSVREIGGATLVVPQFTLVADTRSGRRPSFDPAAPPEHAERAFQVFCETLTALGIPNGRGRFGASMEVELNNMGPATFLLESPGP